MEIKRLFDCIEHQLQHFPQEDMLAAKENGVWRKYSTQEIATTVNQLSAGLLTLGLSGKDYTAEGSDKIVIDLRDCNYIDSSGLGPLVEGLKST